MPAPVLYRVLQGPAPSRPEQEEYRYGAKLLYVDGPAPAEPVRVEGTVVHSTLAETRYFVGDHNPILEHVDALLRIENDKYFEARLVAAAAPAAVAHTELVCGAWPTPAGVAPELYLAWLERQLRGRFPRGFVLKPRSSFASDGRFPSGRTPFVELWRAFKASAEPEMTELRAAGLDDTDIHLRLKAAPSYPGRILDALFTDPASILVQERLAIAEQGGVIEEYRVHVVGGRVLDGGTQHRWGNYRSLDPARLAEVDAFVQCLVGRLPAPYDALTYGVDVVGLADGSLAFMEGNAGWESQYFYADCDLWVANLMAQHYSGRSTPFLDQFARVAAARGLAAKIAELRQLLRSEPLQPAIRQGDPMTEVLARARTLLLDDLRVCPSPAQLDLMRGAITELQLEPYLTYDELDELHARAALRAAA
jgi:hypothetical protein